MRKLLALVLAAVGVQFVLKRRKGRQANAVWHDATRPEIK